MNKKINFAAKGSLCNSAGMDNYLAGTAEYNNSERDVKMISDFDERIAAVHNQHTNNGYDTLTQHYFCPLNLSGNNYFFAIRTCKEFTKFSGKPRGYDRREYFYFDFKSDINHIDFAASLPEMRQYEEKDFNVTLSEIKKGSYNPDGELMKGLFAVLLTGNSVRIKVNTSDYQEVENKILSELSALPPQYAKYIGFGFNVKNDEFSNNYLHIFTTFDECGEVLESLKKSDLNEKLVNHLLSVRYSDAEIVFSNAPIDKSILYTLLDYHKLHFAVDNNDKIAFEKSKKYFEKFANATDKYIKERLQAIYDFWVKNSLLDYDFLQQIDVLDITLLRDKDYENNLIITYQPKGNENIKKYLIKYGNGLDNGETTKLIGVLGLDYFSKESEIVELQKYIESYVQQTIEKSNEKDYLPQAFSIADKYSFKLNVKSTDNLHIYKLLDSNQGFVNNAPEILLDSAKQIIDKIEPNIVTLLNFAKKENTIVKNQSELFITRFTDIYENSNDTYLFLLILLKDIVENNENLFLKKDNNLFKKIEQIGLINKEQFKELKKFRRKIKKTKSQPDIENDALLLIDNLRNQYKAKSKVQKEKAKEEKKGMLSNPIISNEIKLWKIWAISATALFFISVGLTVLLFLNTGKGLEHLVTEHQKTVDPTEKQQSIDIIFGSKLNPYPNDTLKNSKGNYVRIATNNDSIAKVVDRIFTNYKNDVAQYYQFQKEDYKLLLIETNKDCFGSQQNTCECDTLKVIPIYKPKI